MKLGECVYCGELGNTKDHIPASFYRSVLSPYHYPFHEVVACRECNCAIGGKPLHTLAERQLWIRFYWARKVEKLKPLKPWTNAELMTLRPTLRRKLRRKLNIEGKLRRRYTFSQR